MKAYSIFNIRLLGVMAATLTVAWASACSVISGLDEFELIEGERPIGGAGGTSGTAGAGGGSTSTGGGMGQGGTGGTLLPDGTPCAASAQCTSGFCVDGVCCDTACVAACDSCTSALKGTGNDGECGPSATGTACGNTQDCVGSTLWVADSCDGNGVCNNGGTMTCPNGFKCDAAGMACLTLCMTDADCVSARYCNTASGACLADKANGQSCTNPNQCTSGHCVDGFCCDLSCDLDCHACNLPGTEGTCGDVPLGTLDPGCTGSFTTCNATGLCKKPGGAACPGGSSQCASGLCVSGNCTYP